MPQQQKLGHKCYDLLYAHALSGCDTVSYPFGKGKKSVLSLMEKVDLHSKIFSEAAAEHEWMKTE